MSYPPGPPHDDDPDRPDHEGGAGEPTGSEEGGSEQGGSGQGGSGQGGSGAQGQPSYGYGYGQPPSDEGGYGRGYPPPGYGQYGQPGQYGQQEQYGQYGGGQYGQYGSGQAAKTNGKATGSLITGIASLVLSWCCGLGLAGIVAIVLGVKARNEIRASGGTQNGDGMAVAGIITGAIAAVIGLLALVFLVLVIATGSAEYNMDPGTPDFDTNF